MEAWSREVGSGTRSRLGTPRRRTPGCWAELLRGGNGATATAASARSPNTACALTPSTPARHARHRAQLDATVGADARVRRWIAARVVRELEVVEPVVGRRGGSGGGLTRRRRGRRVLREQAIDVRARDQGARHLAREEHRADPSLVL